MSLSLRAPLLNFLQVDSLIYHSFLIIWRCLWKYFVTKISQVCQIIINVVIMNITIFA